jgi:hypothetical protein
LPILAIFYNAKLIGLICETNMYFKNLPILADFLNRITPICNSYLTVFVPDHSQDGVVYLPLYMAGEL